MAIRIINCSWGYQICDGDSVLDTVDDERSGPHRSWDATRRLIDKINNLELGVRLTQPPAALRKGRAGLQIATRRVQASKLIADWPNAHHPWIERTNRSLERLDLPARVKYPLLRQLPRVFEQDGVLLEFDEWIELAETTWFETHTVKSTRLFGPTGLAVLRAKIAEHKRRALRESQGMALEETEPAETKE